MLLRWQGISHAVKVSHSPFTGVSKQPLAWRPRRTCSTSGTTAIPHTATSEASQLLQWQSESDIFYSNYPLDRAVDKRRDAAWVQDAFKSPGALVTPVRGSKVLLQQSDHNSSSVSSSSSISNDSNSSSSSRNHHLQPVWLTSDHHDIPTIMDPETEPLFLGCNPKTRAPYFALQITPEAEQLLAAEPNWNWLPARTAGPSLSPEDAALMAVASGLAAWNRSAQYHGTSGAKTQGANGGFSRVCPETKRSIYPRLDPAVITLVTAGDWCLLGRKEGWPAGR